MKKIILFFAVLLINAAAFAQALPNGTFENWYHTPYENPAGWNDGNIRDIQIAGWPSVTKVSGQTGYAIRIETSFTLTDTTESYIINIPNPCSDPINWTGGIPYTQQPTAITGHYRYDLQGCDTAILIVIFRKNNIAVSFDIFPIRGTGSQLTWTPFSFPLSLSVIPDSLIIAASSSNKITNNCVMDASFLELDNLAFAGATQIIPGGDFENWSPATVDYPVGWNYGGEGVSRTSDNYAGSYAMRIETLASSCGEVNPSGISTGYFGDNGPYGGRPYNLQTDTLTGYYKYTPMGIDSASINVILSLNTNNVGGNILFFQPTANYTYFEIPFGAITIPDTLRIDAYSSTWPTDSSNAGSVLYLDHLQLKSDPLYVPQVASGGTDASIAFPNPVHDVLNILLNRNVSETLRFAVYDITGRMLLEKNISANTGLQRLNVSEFGRGVYVYELRSEKGSERGRFVKE
jgi:hypothetical protein